MSIPVSTLGQTGLSISRIGLGTVEIGLPYGIANKGLPTDQEAEHILKSALDLGITYFDTARAYGLAEERLGKFGISTTPGITIGTKCGQFLKQEPDLTGTDLAQRIRAEIDESRRLLKLDTLTLVQLHLELPDYAHLPELTEIMLSLQSEGKIKYLGVATRGEDIPLAAIQSGHYHTIQTAYSILDQRMAPRVLSTALANNVGIINRSVLLKGVLTDKRSALPAQLDPLNHAADQAAQIAHDLGITLPELAFRFVASHPAVSTILIGTIKPKHLETAIAAVQYESLPPAIITKLNSLGLTDPDQVDPSRWPAL